MIRHLLLPAIFSLSILACGGAEFEAASAGDSGSPDPVDDAGKLLPPPPPPPPPTSTAESSHADAGELPDADAGPSYLPSAAAKACAPGCLGSDGECHTGIGDDRICGTAVSRENGLCQDCVALGAYCNSDQECSQISPDGGVYQAPNPDACVLIDQAVACEGSCNAVFPNDGCGHPFVCPCSTTPPPADGGSCNPELCPPCTNGGSCCSEGSCGCMFNDLCGLL